MAKNSSPLTAHQPLPAAPDFPPILKSHSRIPPTAHFSQEGMSRGICKGKDVHVGSGGHGVNANKILPVVTPSDANSKVDKQLLLRDLEDSLAKIEGNTEGFEGVLCGTKDGNSGIGGNGALEKNNTEGKVRSKWQRVDVEGGTDSSVENGRSQGIGTRGDGGFHGVGGLNSHLSVLIDTMLINVTCTTICRCVFPCPFHDRFY